MPTTYKLETLLKFMCKDFGKYGSDIDYQEAFCRCLAKLLEIDANLHMFVGDGEDEDDRKREEADGSEEIEEWRIQLASAVGSHEPRRLERERAR